MNSPLLIVAGLLYALFFWVLVIQRPGIALLLILASAPFQSDLSGGGPLKFSLAEIDLLLCAPVVLLRGGRTRWGPSLIPALIYLGICGVCALIHWRSTAPICLVQTWLYIVFTVMVFASLVRNIEDYRIGFYGLVAVCTFLAAIVCVLRTPFIFGLQKNGIGGSLAIAILIALELSQATRSGKVRRSLLWACAILAGGCLFSLSRGAWLAGAAGTLVIFAMRRQFGLMGKIALVLVPVIALCWFVLPKQSRDYAVGFQADRWNIQARYLSADYAWDQFKSSPVVGVGVGLRKEYDATNIVLCTLAETGVPGLVAFLGFQVAVALMAWRGYRKANPKSFSFSIFVLSLSLTTAKLAHGMVDHYWGRGPLTVVLGTVGMAAYGLHLQRRERLRSLASKTSETGGNRLNPEMPFLLPPSVPLRPTA